MKMARAGKYFIVSAVGIFVLLWAAWTLSSTYIDGNECSMSWGRFVHVPLNFTSVTSKVSRNYGLYLFREGGVSPHFHDPQEDAVQLGGTPVLFIPGNAGSYSQGRSMASLASRFPEYDWFLAHFDEDLSAMHGKTLVDESRYVNDAIKFILGLYQLKLKQLRAMVGADGDGGSPNVGFVAPESVIIVGHSMGGIVARTLVTLDNYQRGSVSTMITLSTPHAYPPITFDRDTTQLYDLIGQWWREEEAQEIALVSVSGGHSDLMVLPDMTSVNSLEGVSAQSYEIPDVGIGIDHLAIVWCAELREAIINAINRVIDHRSPSRTIPYDERVAVLRECFKVPQESQLTGIEEITGNINRVHVESSILWGQSSRHTINGSSHFILPAKSSLISYRITADQPIKLAQRTTSNDEYRYYGEKEANDATTLIWSASGPFVPQPESGGPLLVAMVEPISNIHDHIKVKVSVDWGFTITNVLLHYRTLAACWPFALVILSVMSKIANNGRTEMSFGRTLVVIVTGRWFWWLSLVFGLLHFMLISADLRTLARKVQFPSEAHNVASLQSVGFIVHDLFLGLYDPHLFWIAPILLAVACCAVSLACFISIMIVKTRNAVVSKFVGSKYSNISDADSVNSTIDSPEELSKETKTDIVDRPKTMSTDSTKDITCYHLSMASLIRSSLLISVLYIVPYQCTTIFLAIIMLLRTSDCGNFEFAFSQILIWTAVVDAPVIVVWGKNLNADWIWAFASVRNIGSVLPLTLYVLKGEKKFELKSWWSRNLTLGVLGYIASYAVMYAGLHAFMLHHLINYLAFWLLIVSCDIL